MENFTSCISRVIPLKRDNVDTDAIIPKQFLKSIKRTGFGVNLFDAWRYLDEGVVSLSPQKQARIENKDFIFNDPNYKNKAVKILLTGKNFGCGSSREHAPWALKDYGIKVIIAKSFADIFFNNCLNNSILPIILDEKKVDSLFESFLIDKTLNLKVDLISQSLSIMSSSKDILDSLSFEINPYAKNKLLEGIDSIDETLKLKDEIVAYENQIKAQHPWLLR